MSKFKIGDRVCSKQYSTYTPVQTGTVTEIHGEGRTKRYTVALDVPLFPDSNNPWPTTTLRAARLTHLSVVEADMARRAAIKAAFDALNGKEQNL